MLINRSGIRAYENATGWDAVLLNGKMRTLGHCLAMAGFAAQLENMVDLVKLYRKVKWRI